MSPGDGRESRNTVVPAEVTELLDRRSRVQGWIEKLGELRDEASPEVFARVREDYEGRLDELNERLVGHRSDLEASLEEHRERVGDLQARRDERAAELEEARLRHAVGEYDEAEWDRRRAAAEEDLEGLDGDLASERAALTELQGTLRSLPGGPDEEPAPVREAVRGYDDAVRTVAGEPPGTPPSEADAEDAGEEGVVDLARLRRQQGPAALEEVDASDQGDAGEEPRAGVPEPSSEEPEPSSGESEGPEQESPGPAAPASESPAAPSAAGPAAPSAEEEPGGEDEEFLDELEFLESLSLDESDRFDAVSAMLEEGEEEDERGEA